MKAWDFKISQIKNIEGLSCYIYECNEMLKHFEIWEHNTNVADFYLENSSKEHAAQGSRSRFCQSSGQANLLESYYSLTLLD